MNYKDEVIDCLTNYPDLFFNRLRVDEHLFAVIGNGYEWHNGQLVSKSYDGKNNVDDNSEIVITDEIKNRFEDYSYDKILKLGRKSRLKFDAEHPEVVKFAIRLNGKPNDYKNLPEEDYLAPATGMYKFKVYPLCEYSKLCNIPNDIKRDWFDAIEYFVDFCLSHHDVIRDEYPNQIEWLNKSKDRINEIKQLNNWN